MSIFLNQLRKAHAIFAASRRGFDTVEAIKNEVDLSTREVLEWCILLRLPRPSLNEKTFKFPLIATKSVVELHNQP